jgi:hypothetical protein
MVFHCLYVLWAYISKLVLVAFHLASCVNYYLSIFIYSFLFYMMFWIYAGPDWGSGQPGSCPGCQPVGALKYHCIKSGCQLTRVSTRDSLHNWRNVNDNRKLVFFPKKHLINFKQIFKEYLFEGGPNYYPAPGAYFPQSSPECMCNSLSLPSFLYGIAWYNLLKTWFTETSL